MFCLLFDIHRVGIHSAYLANLYGRVQYTTINSSGQAKPVPGRFLCRLLGIHWPLVIHRLLRPLIVAAI